MTVKFTFIPHLEGKMTHVEYTKGIAYAISIEISFLIGKTLIKLIFFLLGLEFIAINARKTFTII